MHKALSSSAPEMTTAIIIIANYNNELEKCR